MENVETIKLCDGFKLYNGACLEVKTEDWQEIRKWLHLDIDSNEWATITREVFAFGYVDCVMRNIDNGYKSEIHIEVIPCED